MSKNVLNAIKKVKYFIKNKGSEFERYGLIYDNVLYVTNGVSQVEIPLEMPFNAVVNLHQLFVLLSSIKGESVIVAREDGIIIQANDTTYRIDTLPIESFSYVDINLPQDYVECDNPQIFKQSCTIACDYVKPILNEFAIDYCKELLHICNNVVSFTNGYGAFQFCLDFAMPNMALNLNSLLAISKIVGSEVIKGFNIHGDKLMIVTESLILYTPVLFTDRTPLWFEKISKMFNTLQSQNKVNIEFNDYIIEQFKILSKLSIGKFIFFNNTFCESEDNRIEYPSIGDNNFAFKISISNLFNVLSLTNSISITDNYTLFFQNDFIRVAITGVRYDE